jgi:hypothetical protein
MQETNANWVFFHSTEGDRAEEILSFATGDTVEEAAKNVEDNRLGAEYNADEILHGISEGIIMSAHVNEWKSEYSPDNIPDHERDL